MHVFDIVPLLIFMESRFEKKKNKATERCLLVHTVFINNFLGLPLE